ncbi:hypothetical protein VPNG_02400 [Cytospora leucostoma]|uniref:Uncharacterized protein n=1 Tax=Cytospora leucostoma TaxID=1230097 RepID=A0A423XGR4_9PEZI|nr:hypothetical protein VPNG_02400 [Cytospora leucostoma]
MVPAKQLNITTNNSPPRLTSAPRSLMMMTTLRYHMNGVLSPTSRYVFAAILKETLSGALSPMEMRMFPGSGR